MSKIIKRSLIVLFAFFMSSSFGQINKRPGLSVDRGPCFQKSLDRYGERHPEWECGLDRAIVDCNEMLESDPGSNLVYSRETKRPFTGDCETCYINGIRQIKAHFENGKANGVDTSYYQSGCPQVVRNHFDGVENGTWVYFNDTSGLVAWEISFFNGQKEGRSIYFEQRKVGTATAKVMINDVERSFPYNVYESDTVKVEYYRDGKLDGKKREYFSENKLKKEVNYKEGVFHGAFKEYNRAGKLMSDLRYKMGEKDGHWKYYYNDGSLLKTEEWKNGIKEGEFKTFYIQGFIQTKETYKKGRKHGEFEERFPNDKPKRLARYKNDVLIEDHVFDELGNEIRTIGEKLQKNTEDDELPQKGKKEIKQKKEKKIKESE